MNFLLLDIGATKTRLAVSKDGRGLGRVAIIPTNPKYKDGLLEIAAAAEEIARGFKISEVVAGIAAPLDKNRIRTVDSQNKDWAKRKIAADLRKIFHCPVRVENDAALNGLGEVAYGAGRGCQVVGFLTVSTGVNGVLIIDHKIDRTNFGFELKNLLVPHGAEVDILERMVSGRAIEKRYRKKPENIRNKKVWTEAERILAFSLVNLALTWMPDALVVGGAVMQPTAINLRQVKKIMQGWWRAPFPMPLIKHGILGDQSGLYGALALAKQK